jgi:hypothetical protein
MSKHLARFSDFWCYHERAIALLRMLAEIVLVVSLSQIKLRYPNSLPKDKNHLLLSNILSLIR